MSKNPYKFKKGMKVVRVLTSNVVGQTYREAILGTVTSIKGGIIKFNNEGGITFDLTTGEELERFIPGMLTVIIPVME